jgi:mono/diheme cytochrome c family protein
MTTNEETKARDHHVDGAGLAPAKSFAGGFANSPRVPISKIYFGIAGALLLAIGCAHGSGGDTSAAMAPPADAKAQAAQGGTLYAAHCAKCHGDSGQGVPDQGPPVVGKDALPLDPPPAAKYRKAAFHTARDVYDFVKTNMPAKAPGSLSQDQYLAIVAFDLMANGVDLAGKPAFTPDSLSTVVLHP